MLNNMDKVSNAIYQLLYNGFIDQDDADILITKLRDKNGDLKTGIHLNIELYYKHEPSDFFPEGANMTYPPSSHPDSFWYGQELSILKWK